MGEPALKLPGAPQFTEHHQIAQIGAEALRPPERLSVSEAAEKHRHMRNLGAYVGRWRNDTAPYLVEPMDELASHRYRGWVFCAPSQCGKTEIFCNWLMYAVLCDPADMMLIEVSQARASDFSNRRIDRMHRDTPAIGDRILQRPGSDVVLRKRYVNGMLLNIAWPSVTELSGRPVPRLFLTDYDRMPMDVGAEGSPYDLAQARTTTFGSHGMTAAESSPSMPVMDPQWTRQTPHEAPPCAGILALYNRGDRRRWYWQCRECAMGFEPSFALLEWGGSADPYECGETAKMKCPHCGELYSHDDKRPMNLAGRWLKDGQTLRKDGAAVGTPAQADIASFWLQGVAAAFKDWRTIVSKYLIAHEEYVRTGDENALKATVNTDQAQPYVPRALDTERLPEQLKGRAVDRGHKVVPKGVRFLVASVDVQKSRFVVQVMGVGVGSDLWVVDRFDIRYSLRPDLDNPGQFHRVHPFTYREDWKLLMREVALRRYDLGDGSGRCMAVKGTVCDSGGQDRATSNAYAFWRWLRDGPQPDQLDHDEWRDWVPGLHGRFQLYKGTANKVGYRVKMTWPDAGGNQRYAGARGDVPVLSVHVTPMKNHLDSVLDRTEPGTGMVHFPDWLPLSFYKELCVEVRALDGKWENPKGLRNETWDLFVMAMAMLVERRHFNLEQLDWGNPPGWAREWDANDLVSVREAASPLDPGDRKRLNLSDLAKRLA